MTIDLQPAVQPDAGDQLRPARRRILVIDDDECFRRLLRTLLDKAGYEVIESSNGREGLQVAARTPVDLIITDIIMPEYEGIETILNIRRLYPKLKIMAISGVTANREYLRLSERLGANASLPKADVPELLLAMTRSLIESS